MSRTKIIYFLSAIVLIIGCFALNTSYSLFIDTKGASIVSTSVPTISKENVTLSLPSVDVEGNKEYLIKQTITNNNSIPVGFRISATSDSETYTVQSTKYKENPEAGDETYEYYYSYGTVEANSYTDVYLRVANTNTDTTNVATINFSVEKDYATIAMNTEEYKASANIDNTNQYEITIAKGGVPYSDNTNTLAYKLIDKQITKFCGNGLSCLFTEQTNKITLPIESSFNVPSPTEFKGGETNDVGLYQAEDDYGTSYYYRGANSYNYVDFAGFIWRIVRINGDGSIRLILNGTLDKVKHNGTSVYLNTKLKALDSDGKVYFNAGYEDNAFVGYMYGEFETPSTSYDEAHKNINSSTIKNYVDTFYEEFLTSEYIDLNGNKITNENNKDVNGIGYEKYLADTMFCGDKTRASGYLNDGYGKYGTTFYGAYSRLFTYSSTSNSTPTLRCASKDIVADKELTEEQLAYSRYTSIVDNSNTTSKGVVVNNSLKYPIALLSADEVAMAGAFFRVNNTSYYLSDDYGYEPSIFYYNYVTMTPVHHENRHASIFYDILAPSSDSFGYHYVNNDYGVRPVINLKADILWDSGDGTQESPYTIKVS